LGPSNDHVYMLKKLWKWLRRMASGEPLATRLSRDEAIEIARLHLVGVGLLVDPSATPIAERGKVVWRVVTHAYVRGAHQQVYIDDQTGTVLRTFDVSH
jgi:hypothetical protein